MTSLDVTQYVEAIEREKFAPPEWNLPIEHWSPSSLDMMRRCPYQWQQRYVHGRKERPAEAPVMGLAVHRGIERNFEQKIESREDLPITELLDWYSEDAFIRVVLEEQEKAGEDVHWDTDPDSARARGRKILGEYHNVVAPRVQPLSVEGKISVDLGAHVPVEGRFDVERDMSVIDVKSGKRKTTKPKESWRIQAAVYGEAKLKPVEFHSVSATSSTGAVSIVTPLESASMLVVTSAAEREEIRKRVRAISLEACLYMQLYGPDEPWPTHGRWHTWACDFCGFRNGCPAWRED